MISSATTPAYISIMMIINKTTKKHFWDMRTGFKIMVFKQPLVDFRRKNFQ